MGTILHTIKEYHNYRIHEAFLTCFERRGGRRYFAGIFGSLIGKGREILILHSRSYVLEPNKVIYHEQYECSIIIRGVRKACQQAIS